MGIKNIKLLSNFSELTKSAIVIVGAVVVVKQVLIEKSILFLNFKTFFYLILVFTTVKSCGIFWGWSHFCNNLSWPRSAYLH